MGGDGKSVDFGSIMGKENLLSKNYPLIIDGIRVLHEKRNKLIISHAFDKKTINPTEVVRRKDQNDLFNLLRNSYQELISTLEKIM